MNAPHRSEAIDQYPDSVTGLPGRDAARRRLGEWVEQGAPIHAMLLGLRRFDSVNSTFGTAAGDAALLEVSQRLRHFAGEALDGPWLSARNSGGQFLLIAQEGCSRERWQFLANELLDLLGRPVLTGEGTIRLAPRLVLLRGVPGESADVILDRLNHSLAQLMEGTGRRLRWADGATVKSGRSAVQLDADLHAALDRDEIEIAFQPQFACIDDRLVGAEALARWNHPVLGKIGAGPLFAVAERAELTERLSHHIAQRSLHLARDWPDPLRLSLNITPNELGRPGFAGHLVQQVIESGFPFDRLTLEVTEQVLIGDLALAADAFATFAGRGIRLALDDFGAGFCNFRYLKLLPLHYLKLDRSMLDDVAHDPRDLAVLRGLVAMAKALGLKVIAEGVESEDQRSLVAAEGCDTYQGFLRAQPMSDSDFLSLSASLSAQLR